MIYGSKNKGDWGEMYTLIYLLGSRTLYSADENLNRVPGTSFPLVKAIRDERIPVPRPTLNHIEFNLSGVNDVEIYFNNTLVRTLTSADFQAEAALLCRDIPDDNTHVNVENGQFTIPHGETFINNIFCQRLSAASDDITDIKLKLHDVVTGTEREVGFSVKSYLGGAPTLLNASGATNFTYIVNGISDTDMVRINAINTRTKIKDRLSVIESSGGSLQYCRIENTTFKNNLRKMDGDIENILAQALICYYKSNIKKCTDVIGRLEASDPLGCGISHLYEYKFKRFLCAKALGLEPSAIWSGEDDANGGYIVAKANGEVLAFHLYDRDKFKNYLFQNTKFETASTTRHGYGSVYIDENGNKCIKLNLQIRFV